MPIQNIKGLKGLPSLSEQERKAFIGSIPGLNRLPASYQNQIYRTKQFLDLNKGTDQLKMLPQLSPEMLDKAVEQQLIVGGLKDKFGDEASQYFDLDLQGMEDVYFNNDIMSDAEIEAFHDKTKNDYENLRKTNPFRFAMLASQGSKVPNASDPMAGAPTFDESIEDLYKLHNDRKAHALNTIREQSDLRRAKDPDIIAFNNNLSKAISDGQPINIGDAEYDPVEWVTSRFDEIGQGSNAVVETEFGNYELPIPGSDVYKAFKDTRHIQDMPIDDKMKFVSLYEVMREKYGDILASRILDNKLKEYVNKSQSGWEWFGNDLKRIGTGVPAYIMGDIMGFEALYLGAKDAATGGDSMNQFLNGVDEEGNLIGKWNNPKYWDGVDKYGTFSVDAINAANHNGGISPNSNIYEPGTELSLFSWQTANEGFNMSKFIIAEGLKSFVLRGAGKGIMKPMGGVFEGMNMNMQASSKAARTANKLLTTGIVLDSGTSLAHPYALQTYDQTKAEAEAIRDEQMYNTVEKMLSEELASEDTEKLINQMVLDAKEAYETSGNDTYNVARPKFDENAYRQQMWEEYANYRRYQLTEEYKNSDTYKADTQKAEDAAVNSYMVDYIMEAGRMALTNKLWGQYKFDQGTKQMLNASRVPMSNVRFAEDGTAQLLRGADKAKHITKRVLSPLWDGFQSNYLDDVTVGAAKGFGLGEYNNYMANKYNPEKRFASGTAFGNFLAGINYMGESAVDAMADPQSWYDGWVGLVGSGMAFNPGAMRSRKSFGGKVLEFTMTNPLLSGARDAVEEINGTNEVINQFNENLQHNRAQFEDLYNIISANNRVVVAGQENMVDAKDAKVVGAIQLMDMLERWSQDPVLSQSPAVKEYVSDMQNLVNEQVSDEDKQQLVAQFLANNPSFGQNLSQEERNAAAYNRVIENVQKMREYYEKYKNFHAEADSRYEGYADPEILDQLAMTSFMMNNWRERILEMEEQVSESHASEQPRTGMDYFMSQKSEDAYFEQANDKIAAFEERLNNLSKKIEELENIPSRKRTQKQKWELRLRSLEHEAASLALDDLKNEVSSRDFFESSEEAYNKLEPLSAQEILDLHYNQRARMFKHPEYYSAAQKTEIQKAKDILKRRGDDVEQMVYDIATLHERIEESGKALDRFYDKNNADAAAMYLQKLSEQRDNNIEKVLKKFALDQIQKKLDEAQTDDDFLNAVYEGRGIPAHAVQKYLEDNPERKNAFTTELVKALQVSDDSFKAIGELVNKETDPQTYHALIGQVANLLHGVSTVANAIKTLEEAAEVADDPINKNYLERLLDKLETMQYQRNTKKPEKSDDINPNDVQELTDEPTNIGSEETLVSIEGDVDLGEVDSPTVDDQAKTTGETIVMLPTQEGTDAANTLQTSGDLLAGNPFVEYDATLLREQGIMHHKTGKKENDSMNQFYSWLSEIGVKMQNIVDNELGRILKANPKTPVQFLYRKPQGSADELQHQMILVIENIPDVRKIHNEDNGALVVNGKEYLVIGSIWADLNNPTQKDSYLRMRNDMQQNRKQYFDTHPEEMYYIDSKYHTQVHEMTGGYLVKQMPNNAEIAADGRDVAELANGQVSERNPEGLSLEDLKWGISIGGKMVPVGISERNAVYPSKSLVDRQGSTCLFVQGANGVYIPTTIMPTMLDELREGSALQQRIYTALNNFTSPVYDERIAAREELRNLLSFNNEKTLLTTKNGNTVTVINGERKYEFNLGEKFDRASFLQAVSDAKFRINITAETLRSKSLLQEYSDSGALRTDLAKLGTADAIFDVYQCDETGKPIIKEEASWNEGEPIITSPERKTVVYQNTSYHKINDKFYHPNGKEVSEEVAQELKYLSEIQDRAMQPSLVDNGSSYYIMQSGEHPLVVKIDSKGQVIIANENTSRATIQVINERAAKAAAKNAAEVVIDGIKAEQQSDLQTVDLGESAAESEVMTPEEMNAALLGTEDVSLDDNKENTNTPITPIVTENKADINSISSIIQNNLHNSEKSSNFAAIYRNNQTRAELQTIFKEKGWSFGKTIGGIKSFLQSKGIATEGISDVNAWLRMIRECK